jgi:hypothetical protein
MWWATRTEGPPLGPSPQSPAQRFTGEVEERPEEQVHVDVDLSTAG